MSIPIFPTPVSLIEVGPRDGFQNEARIIPTALKLRLIDGLVRAGFKTIQVASFVNPQKVPQMADSEAVVARLPKYPGVLFTGLVLNGRGMERALGCGLSGIEVSASASERHSMRNAGMSRQEAIDAVKSMIQMSKPYPGLQIRASIQCVFGCPDEEPPKQDVLLEMADVMLEAGAHSLCLADTTGMATPASIERTLSAFHKRFFDLPIGLHLHDTRGMGLINVYVALGLGVRSFDVSFGGLGGCPFVPKAAGNIATEDTIGLLDSLDIRCGIDPRRVAACSRELAAFLGKSLPGRCYRLYREN